MFGYSSVCRLSVCNSGAPYSEVELFHNILRHIVACVSSFFSVASVYHLPVATPLSTTSYILRMYLLQLLFTPSYFYLQPLLKSVPVLSHIAVFLSLRCIILLLPLLSVPHLNLTACQEFSLPSSIVIPLLPFLCNLSAHRDFFWLLRLINTLTYLLTYYSSPRTYRFHCLFPITKLYAVSFYCAFIGTHTERQHSHYYSDYQSCTRWASCVKHAIFIRSHKV